MPESMINWFSIVANGLWISGLAIILAGLSYYYWLAGQLDHSFKTELNNPAFQKIVIAGLLLVGFGLLLTADNSWQMLPAAALIFICVFALYTLYRKPSNNPPGS